MTIWRSFALLLALTAVLAIGCGDDNAATDGGTDGGTDTDTDTDSDSDTDTDTDADGGMDESTSCADALLLNLNAIEMIGAFTNMDDEDFFLFTATADQWLEFRTNYAGDDIVGVIDPVLSLYNEDGATLLASADDSVPRGPSRDSIFDYHVATAGTYCLKIETFDHWASAAQATGITNWTYNVSALVMSPDTAGGITMDTEPNETLAAGTAMNFVDSSTSGYQLSWLLGMGNAAGDVDVYSMTPATDYVAATFGFRPSGTGGPGVEGHGSTMDLGVVDLVDDIGGVIARLDVANGSEEMSVPIEAGEVVGLEIQGAADWTPGANDFYAVIVTASQFDNAPEDDETAATDGGVLPSGGNDTLATANTVVFTEEVGVAFRGNVLGFIDPVDDVDYFEFAAEAGETVYLWCYAARNGSGLVNTEFTILDASETVIQTEVESPEYNLEWTDPAYGGSMAGPVIATTGNYYLKVTGGSQDPNVQSNFYRCYIARLIPAK
jgi:hypothetical protein